MNRKLTAALIVLSVLFGGKPAFAQTAEPTPEVTPVVIEAPEVVIPDDVPVIVVDVPETPAEPAPTLDLGLLAAIAGIVLIGFFALFGATVIKLGNSAPPWAVAAFIGGVDAVKPAVNKWVGATPTTLDDATIAEVWKEIDKLKSQVGANTSDIEAQKRTQGGL